MTDPRLIRLRVELFTAAQTLKGEDLAEFKKLIREITEIFDFNVTWPTDAGR